MLLFFLSTQSCFRTVLVALPLQFSLYGFMRRGHFC